VTAAGRLKLLPATWARTLRFRRFAVVGVVNTLVDYVLFVGLTKILHLPLDWVWIAKVISGTVAISVSFYLNRTWVFNSAARSFGQATRFLVVTVVAVYGIQTPLTHVFASLYPDIGQAFYAALVATGLPEAFPTVLTEAFAIKTAAFAIATSVSMMFNFFLYRFWVFRQ
jgi:putative flippase GtrA